MTFHIITIFPDIFDSYFNESILKRARKKKIIDIKIHNLRDWTFDKHKTVDDAPYGGGAGMVMKVEPIYRALSSLRGVLPPRETTKQSRQGGKNKIATLSRGGFARNDRIILLSAKGKKWNQQLAKKYSKLDNIILICGRYEGVDERVKKFVDDEISIGDYVLTGGEIGAMAIVDSITRLLPGVLGNVESTKYESHSTPGLLEYPQYTRPEVFQIPPLTKGARGISKSPLQKGGRGVKKNSPFNKGGWGDLQVGKKITYYKKYRVPKILLSGNHKKIEEWRKKMKKIK